MRKRNLAARETGLGIEQDLSSPETLDTNLVHFTEFHKNEKQAAKNGDLFLNTILITEAKVAREEAAKIEPKRVPLDERREVVAGDFIRADTTQTMNFDELQ